MPLYTLQDFKALYKYCIIIVIIDHTYVVCGMEIVLETPFSSETLL